MVLNATLWYRAAAWVRQTQARPDMTLFWSCCGMPALGEQTLIGRHGGRDALVATCSHCGAEWLSLSQAENPSDWQLLKHSEAAPARTACKPARVSDEHRAWRKRKQRDLED